MFNKKIDEQFSKIVEKYKLKQLYILFFIPLAFSFTKLFYELSFHDTFFHWLFLITVAVLLFLSAFSGFKFNKFNKLTCTINSSLIIVGIAASIYCYYSNKLPQLPDDKLVVLITKFTPVSPAAEEDSENIPHRIEQELQKKQTEGIPLEIKRISKRVIGSNKDSRYDHAIKIGSSKEGHAHVILWGDVRKDEDELYVTPKITIIKKMENVYDRETEFSRKENNHIEFKERIAKEISNIIIFICGLAFYETKRWDEAIQLFDRTPSDETQYYKGLCLYNRAFTTEQPKQDLLAAYRVFYNIFEPKKSDLYKFEEELYFEVQNYLVKTLIALSNLSDPQISLDYLRNAENISRPICNYLAKSIQENEGSVKNNFLNLYLARENLGTVLSMLGEMLSGDEGVSYLEEAIKICISAQTDILQKLAPPPSQWQAATFSNLGVAFSRLERRLGTDNGKVYLEKAIESHRNALEILQKNKLITKGDMTYYNLALALSNLGEMISGENGIRLFKESIVMLEKSLELNKKEEFSYKWASIQNALGGTFFNLSYKTKDEELLLKSIEKFQDALIVFERSKYPRNWSDTHHNIGLALNYRGIIINSNKSVDFFSEAILHFNHSLSIYEGQKNTNAYIGTLKIAADAYSNCGIALNNLGMYDKAIEQFKKAIEIGSHNTNAFYYLGMSYLMVGQKDDAVKIFRHVLELEPEASIKNNVSKLLHDLTQNE